MTLYKALKATGNATDNGWKVLFPNGEEEVWDFFGIAMDAIMWANPSWLTLHVDNMEMDECGRFCIQTSYGAEYIGDMSERLGDDDNGIEVKDAIRMMGLYKKRYEDITLGEVDTISEMANCTPGDVIEVLNR